MSKVRLRACAAAVAISIGLSGCFVPMKEIRVGTEITPADLKWVRVGETDRAQVLARFGQPDVDFVDRRTIAYAWAGISGILCGYSCVGLEMSRALIIRFDAAGKVAAFSIVDRPLSVPSYDALDRWRTPGATGWTAVIDEWLAAAGSKSDLRR